MKIIVVGAGAAGFFSAIHNKEANPHAEVVIIERSSRVLSKVKISGGGRCNVTHACYEPRDLLGYYPRGAKALLGAFHSFAPQDTCHWFESRNVALKTESDGRIFPQSDSSQSIIDCLIKEADRLGVKLWTSCKIVSVTKDANQFSIQLANDAVHLCDKLILATGSSKFGYDCAANLGHTIIKPVPSLFTFSIKDKLLHDLKGLAVQQVKAWIDKKSPQFGPLLITHWGLSGPAVIKLSAWHARDLFESNYQSKLTIDFLPEHSFQDIDSILSGFIKSQSKKALRSISPFQEIPQRLWQYLIQRSTLSLTKVWQELGPKQKRLLIEALKNAVFHINGKSIFKEEFVTCGGIALDEMNFKTMESKLCSGLHIVGELLDIDGVTGGFNFQNAWTTAFLSSR